MESVGGISVRLRFSKTIESLSISFHHVDFDFSNPDNDMKVIDDLLIDKCLLILLEIKIENSMTKIGDSTIHYCIDSN